MLGARNVAGVVFIEEIDSPVLDHPLWEKLRAVYCGPYPSGDDADCPFPIVRGNIFAAVCMAWQKAVAASFQRIGLLMTIKGSVLNSLEKKK